MSDFRSFQSLEGEPAPAPWPAPGGDGARLVAQVGRLLERRPRPRWLMDAGKWLDDHYSPSAYLRRKREKWTAKGRVAAEVEALLASEWTDRVSLIEKAWGDLLDGPEDGDDPDRERCGGGIGGRSLVALPSDEAAEAAGRVVVLFALSACSEIELDGVTTLLPWPWRAEPYTPTDALDLLNGRNARERRGRDALAWIMARHHETIVPLVQEAVELLAGKTKASGQTVESVVGALLRRRNEGEVCRSNREDADDLGCSPALVAKAFKLSPELRMWRDQTKPKAAPPARDVASGPIIDNLPQSREPDPAESSEGLDDENALQRLMEEGPAERAAINAMDERGRRELLQLPAEEQAEYLRHYEPSPLARSGRAIRAHKRA